MLGQLILGIHSAVNLMIEVQKFISLLLLVNYVFATIEGLSFLHQIILMLDWL